MGDSYIVGERDSVKPLLVSEVFGPTFQGEGRFTGRPAMFVRLGLCNLDCSWCDTPYTWDWSRFDRSTELASYTETKLWDLSTQIVAAGPDLVVVSGGEPLVQQAALTEFLSHLSVQPDDVPFTFQVETNGTLPPSQDLLDLVDWWSVSPKLGHATGNPAVNSPKAEEALEVFTDLSCSRGTVDWKFVCQTVGDVDEVAAITVRHHIPASSVWIMPEGVTVEAMQRPDLAEAALLHGFNMTTRLHVLLWGTTRGK